MSTGSNSICPLFLNSAAHFRFVVKNVLGEAGSTSSTCHFVFLIFNQLQFDDEGPVSAPKRTSTQSQVVNEVLFGF